MTSEPSMPAEPHRRAEPGLVNETGDPSAFGCVDDSVATAEPTSIDNSWTDLARCKGRTHLFYDQPRESEAQRLRRETLAKRYCAACPVAGICRTMGRLGREHGVWGGETDEERAAAGYLPMRSTSRRIRAAWQPRRQADHDVA